MNGGVDGGAVAHIIYSLCTANDLQSRIHYFIVACVEFQVNGEMAGGVDAYMKHLLCTDNDL